MQKRILLAIVVSAACLLWLVITLVSSSYRLVFTVEDLLRDRLSREDVQVGAKVAEAPALGAGASPEKFRFTVHGVDQQNLLLTVVFSGSLPDGLASGRDVLLEGSFDGEKFHANRVLLRCPSKYEPPAAKG